MSVRVARTGGRVVLLDPDDRVLLIHERIEDGTTHWLTPGGGLEGTETAAQAAVRETFEETGLRISLALPHEIHRTQRLWTWEATVFDQADHFFLARAPHEPVIAPQGLTAMEQRNILGHAWWTIPQLRDSDEVFVPADLADVIERVLREPSAER